MEESIWGIKGYSYSGCEGWSEWICEGLIFSSNTKAWDHIENKLKNTYSRYEPYEISVK
ncbi:MAG TPA: hypothetical protein VIK86_04760 [Candidatus Paceibacterota bacterium]